MIQRVRFVMLVLYIAPALLCCGMPIAVAVWAYGPKPSIPEYPNRQHIQVTTERIGSSATLRTTTFKTTDTPDVVLDFYRRHLGPSRSDWQEVGANQRPIYGENPATKEGVVFTYNEEYWGQPSTTLGIATRYNATDGLLTVILRLYRS
jgi:hypothetical protein